MKRRHTSTYTANNVQEHLLNRVGRHIKRRQMVLQNENRFCFNKLSHLIEQTNNQITLANTIRHGSIQEAQDHHGQKADSMMSVPQGNVTMRKKASISIQGSSRRSSLRRQRKSSSMYTRGRRSMTCIDLSSVIAQANRRMPPEKVEEDQYMGEHAVVPLEYSSDEEEDKHVQMLRLTKEQQMQEEEKERERLRELNRRRVKIDLSNERIMFDFQCKVTKIEAPRAKDNIKMLEIQGSIGDEQAVKNRSPYNTTKVNAARKIKNVSNITEQQKQKQKLKLAKSKYRNKHLQEGDESGTQSMSSLVVVNPQTHKQTEKAFSLENQGIRIKIQDREISIKRQTAFKETSIKKRLSKSQYIEFKKNEQKRKRSMLMKFKNEERKRAHSEGKIIPEPIVQEPSQKASESSSEVAHQLKYPQAKTDNGTSRIFVNNQLMRTDLLRQYKDKQSLKSIQKPTNQSTSNRESMSSVDRYNLLYVKYGGKPPSNLLEVAKQLRKGSRQTTEPREKATPKSKYSWLGTTRQSTIGSSRQTEERRLRIKV